MFCNMSSSGIQVFLILAWNKWFDNHGELQTTLSEIHISFMALVLLQEYNLFFSVLVLSIMEVPKSSSLAYS